MKPQSIKRATLFLFGVSFYMLYTILLVVVEPAVWLRIVLMIVFAFLAYGLECFFSIGSEKKPAAFSSVEFAEFWMFLPSVIYLIFGLANFADLRSELLRTSLTAFLSMFFGGIFEVMLGRGRTPDKHDGDDGDGNGE